jgi:hypothetical protein
VPILHGSRFRVSIRDDYTSTVVDRRKGVYGGAIASRRRVGQYGQVDLNPYPGKSRNGSKALAQPGRAVRGS